MIRRNPCPRCKGTGESQLGDEYEKHMDKWDECSRCNGTGLDEFREGFEEMGVEDDAI